MVERLGGGAEQGLRPERLDAEKPVLHDRVVGRGERRQKQRVAPDEDADGHAERRPAAIGAAPDKSADQRRGELGDGCERHQADGGQAGVVGAFAIIEEGDEQDDDDGRAADIEDQRRPVLVLDTLALLQPAQEKRDDEVVRDHDGERDALHDDHGGGGRQTADKGDHGEKIVAVQQRQREHVEIAAGARADAGEAGKRDRQDEEVDGDQIERKHPGGCPELGFGAVLDHGDVELARQHQYGEAAERGQHQPARRRGPIIDGLADLLIGAEAFDHPGRAAEHHEGDDEADGQEGRELDDRFHRDRQHEPVLVLGRVGVTGAEQNGEHRQQRGDDQRNVADHRVEGRWRAGVVFDHQADGIRDRLELQGDVGDHADGGDQRGRRGDDEALAVARSQEIGHRRDLLRLGQPDDAPEQRKAEQEHQDRPGVDAEELETAFRRNADGAEEGPGRAIDGEAQRVDQRARASWSRLVRPAVAKARDDEQKRHIGDRYDDDEPALHFAKPPAAVSSPAA